MKTYLVTSNGEVLIVNQHLLVQMALSEVNVVFDKDVICTQMLKDFRTKAFY